MKASLNNITIEVIQGDIASQVVDAIVHSANPELEMNTGLGRHLLAVGGNVIQEECRAIGACEVGQATITSAGNLSAKHVIHAVGPHMGSGNERGKLGSTIWNTLKLAEKQKMTSIVFPAIATGRSGGFPMEGCALVMAQKITDFTFEEVQSLARIVVCLYTAEAYTIFESTFRKEVDDAQQEAPG